MQAVLRDCVYLNVLIIIQASQTTSVEKPVGLLHGMQSRSMKPSTMVFDVCNVLGFPPKICHLAVRGRRPAVCVADGNEVEHLFLLLWDYLHLS